MHDHCVVNASPLIILAKIGQFDLLGCLTRVLRVGLSWSASHRSAIGMLGVLTFGGAASVSLAASQPGIGLAQPTTYVSPSGRYSLSVDPADRNGHGAAQYRFSRNSVTVWSAEKPYALREVVVTDDGLAAGFAYRIGPKRDEQDGQLRPVGGPQNPPQYLHLVILNPSGSEVLNDVTERVDSRFFSTPPSPLRPCVEQFLVDPPNDRLVARVFADGEKWWAYRLSTGECLDRFDSRERMGNKHQVDYVPLRAAQPTSKASYKLAVNLVPRQDRSHQVAG